MNRAVPCGDRKRQCEKDLACAARIIYHPRMVNVPQAATAIASGFGIPRSQVYQVARTIREQDPTLLPRDPVGRNLGTDLVPPHYTNLMVGTAAADPVATVAVLVRAYRAARYTRPIEEVRGEVEPRRPILGGQTLGLDLDGLINRLAGSSDEARKFRMVAPGRFRVALVVGEALVARVEDLETGQVDQYDAKGRHSTPGGQTFRFQGQERQVVPLRRVAYLEFAHFELAAELWADSLKHGAVYTPSLLDLSDDEPETETAASGPCRDQNAAAVSDQTADTVLDGASQTHPISEREKSQLPRVKRSGRHFHPSGTTHDRKESHSTSAAFT